MLVHFVNRLQGRFAFEEIVINKQIIRSDSNDLQQSQW